MADLIPPFNYIAYEGVSFFFNEEINLKPLAVHYNKKSSSIHYVLMMT